jgi:hypothetical protein
MNTESLMSFALHIGKEVLHPEYGVMTVEGIHTTEGVTCSQGMNGKTIIVKAKFTDLELINKMPMEEEEQQFRKLVENISGLSFPNFQKQYKSRKRELVDLRQLHMTWMCKCRKFTLNRSGYIYKKDHATALHACREVKNLIHNTDFKIRYREIINFILQYNSHAFDV